jgi:Pyridoxamine 5'-phosphate oxidase
VTVTWDDEIDDVIGGDAAVGFASVTPARGVVIVPMAPLGLRDRDAGTVTITSSLGLPKKLARLRNNPSVALVYHAREHGFSSSSLYVVLQGTASVEPEPDRAWLESITPQWERFLGPRHTGVLGRLMDIYYWERVAIRIQVRRVLVHDGTVGPPRVLGEALPADVPPSQAAPKGGAGPRVDTSKVASHLDRLPHSLLGWVGSDGLPMVVRVRSAGGDEHGVRLTSPDGALPNGARRAGLTAHSFQRHMVGQEQRVHTGWLEVDGGEAVYAPHTRSGHALPGSRLLFAVGAGIGMRPGYKQARKLGLVEPS